MATASISTAVNSSTSATDVEANTPLGSKKWPMKPVTRSSVLLILATMAYKFAFESLSSAVGLFVLTRFADTGVTMLAVLVVLYGFLQSIGSSAVGQLSLRTHNLGRLLTSVLLSMAGLIAALLLLELFSGGDRKHLASWNPWIIFPIYLLFGACVGMLEISRKILPRQILGSDAVELKSLNAKVHIFYEVSGTSGALLSTLLITYMGPIYSLFHLPPFFLLSAVLFWMTIPPPDNFMDLPELEGEKTMKQKFELKPFLQNLYFQLKTYCVNLKVGGKLVLGNRKYWWLVIVFVVPQVLHRLIENLLIPVFTKKVLNDGSLSGIIVGGSNFGELLGAFLVMQISRYVKNPLHYCRIDAVLLGLLWVFAFIPLFSKSIVVASSLIPLMVLVSGFWAAGDISLLAYVQSSFSLKKTKVPSSTSTSHNVSRNATFQSQSEQGTFANMSKEEECSVVESFDPTGDEEEDHDSPLTVVMGFLYACYAIIVALVAFGLGQWFDAFAKEGDIRQGFFWIGGVLFSCLGGLIFLATFVPKSEYFAVSTVSMPSIPEQKEPVPQKTETSAGEMSS